MHQPSNWKKDHLLLILLWSALAGALWAFLWFTGIAPASTSEREFIEMLADSPYRADPRILQVLLNVQDAPYLSRGHFLAAEEAFNALQIAAE